MTENEKQSFFATFYRMGITPELAEEYFQSDLYRQQVVDMPLPVVYQTPDEKIEVHKKLYLKRFAEITGIKFKNLLIFGIEYKMCWEEALAFAQAFDLRLPTITELGDIIRNQAEINNAFNTFNRYRLEGFSGLQGQIYLTSECVGGKPWSRNVYAITLNDRVLKSVKRKKRYWVRLVRSL